MAAPVEYAVAVDRYLANARISSASRRVYRVTLATWGWLLVGRTPPTGQARRGAHSPVVALARLDGDPATTIIRDALDHRALMEIDQGTYEREVSILRNAAHWWAAQGWIGPQAERALKRHISPRVTSSDHDLIQPSDIDPIHVFALRVPLREQTLWRLIYETAAPAEHLLALDVSDLDLAHRKVRRKGSDPRQADRITWTEKSAELLPLLTIGRTAGPVFLTERRAAAHVPQADRCPYSGRARLSMRRATELFRVASRELDPHGAGWTLRDLRTAGKRNRGGVCPTA
jgi:integrase/recombinase XerD